MQDGIGRAPDIGYQLGQISEAVESLDHRLFGNGQIGIIETHSREIELLKDALKEQNTKRKMALWGLRAIGAMLVWTWGVLMGAANWWPKLQSVLHALGF